MHDDLCELALSGRIACYCADRTDWRACTPQQPCPQCRSERKEGLR